MADAGLLSHLDLSTQGRRLRFFRQAKGWSQAVAAKKVYVSQATWSLWERDLLTPELPKQRLVADLFDVGRTYLWDGEAAA